LQHLGPSVSGGDDLVAIGAPGEGPGFGAVVPGDEAIDGGLEIDDGVEDAVLQPASGQLGGGISGPPGIRSRCRWPSG
jgi:hypothetical protein